MKYLWQSKEIEQVTGNNMKVLILRLHQSNMIIKNPFVLQWDNNATTSPQCIWETPCPPVGSSKNIG